MLPSYCSRNQDSYIPVEEYTSHKSTAVKKMSPLVTATDHSQRIGKLLPYISSMQQRRVNEKEYLLNSNSRTNIPSSLILSS